MRGFILTLVNGTLDARPAYLTLVQSVIVTVLATLMSAGLYLGIGIHLPGIGYQIFAALVIASILAPIFLYPTFRTASRLRQAYATIRTQAYTDRLTTLPNSSALLKELEIRVQEDASFAIHLVDIARFRAVNDGLGLDAGDALLAAVAEALRVAVGSEGFVARFGIDQFAVLQPGSPGAIAAGKFARDLLEAISRLYDILGNEIVVTASAGTALVPSHGSTPQHIVRAADLALRQAKALGIHWQLFDEVMGAAASNRRQIEVALRAALADDALQLAYQPIVRASDTTEVVAVEALMRWPSVADRVVMPADFIPVAESTGLIVRLGEWALRTACLECVKWRSNVCVAVNVSPIQVQHGDFVEIVESALAESGLTPNRLELEITESMLISDTSVFAPALLRLRGMGICIALDDFGSGFCGLNYLRRFLIDKIKVDKSIIDDAICDERAANILRGVSKIAAESGMTVTVEGVDTIEKEELIRKENCADHLQGFLYSRPLTAVAIEKILGATPGRPKLAKLRVVGGSAEAG